MSSGIKYSNIDPLQTQERRRAGCRGQHPAQREPMVLADLSFCDGHEARQPGFRRQQIIEATVEAMFADVVADGKQIVRLVEQEGEVHVRQFVALMRQLLQGLDALGRSLRGIGDGPPELAKPVENVLCLRGGLGVF